VQEVKPLAFLGSQSRGNGGGTNFGKRFSNRLCGFHHNSLWNVRFCLNVKVVVKDVESVVHQVSETVLALSLAPRRFIVSHLFFTSSIRWKRSFEEAMAVTLAKVPLGDRNHADGAVSELASTGFAGWMTANDNGAMTCISRNVNVRSAGIVVV
jgi:hypothetical protein